MNAKILLLDRDEMTFEELEKKIHEFNPKEIKNNYSTIFYTHLQENVDDMVQHHNQKQNKDDPLF